MSDRRWRLRSPDHFELARFNGEALAFNPISWQTHLVNDTATAALEALKAAPRSLQELASAVLGPDADDSDTAEEMEIMASLVAELEELGLIESEQTGDAIG